MLALSGRRQRIRRACQKEAEHGLFREMRDPVIPSNTLVSRAGKATRSGTAPGSPASAAPALAGAMSRSQHAAAARPEGASMSDAREVMNIRQASQYLGISADTLYKYVSEETIPAFKLGNRWKFKKSILDSWMEERSLNGESLRPRKVAKAVRASAAAD
jgi:excisionase family DNA binding protein